MQKPCYKLNSNGDFQYYTINKIDKKGLVKHAFSTRKGGVSEDCYHSLNLSFKVGDDKDNVLKNREIFGNALKISVENLVTINQVHGDKILVIDREMNAPIVNQEKDAIITNQKNVAIAVLTADCLPIIILDFKMKVVGVIHAGWRGLLNNIIVKTLTEMKKTFGSEPENCLAAIGPSIGPCCYEIDRPFINLIKEKCSYWMDLTNKSEEQKWKLDLWKWAEIQLTEAGITKLENMKLCTACHNNMFYSYRGEKGKTGRMINMIMLK